MTSEPVLDEELELLPRRRGRGRPRHDGLVPDEIRAALDGRLGDRLQRLARLLEAIDIGSGATLPRICDDCEVPVRYSLKCYGVLNLYCPSCFKSTNRVIGPLPRDEEPGDRPDTCPECGSSDIHLDPRRGEVFCLACWATIGPAGDHLSY